jgi:hypothetical protein
MCQSLLGRGFSAAVVLLAAGDFLWSLAFVLSSGALFFFRGSFSYGLCAFLRLLYQLGAISSLCWSLCILLLIVESFDEDHRNRQKVWFVLTALFAYGWPCILVAVFLSLKVKSEAFFFFFFSFFFFFFLLYRLSCKRKTGIAIPALPFVSTFSSFRSSSFSS